MASFEANTTASEKGKTSVSDGVRKRKTLASDGFQQASLGI